MRVLLWEWKSKGLFGHCCQVLFVIHRKIAACFDGGRIISDAGLLLFYALDRQHRISEGFSTCLKDRRGSRDVRHSMLEMIRQRLHQILCG